MNNGEKESKSAKRARRKSQGQARLIRLLRKRWGNSRKRPRRKGIATQREVYEFLRANVQGPGYPLDDKAENRYVIKCPKVFSLLDNPDESLECIYKLIRLPSRPYQRTVLIDQSEIQQLDLAANTVFDLCAMIVQSLRSGTHKRYNMTGYFPIDQRIRNLVKVMGITKHLSVKNTEAPDEFKKNVRHFALKHGKRGSDQAKTATRLSKHLSNCFKDAGFDVGLDFVRDILKWAGEIMTNAEEHSGMARWYAMSYMAPLPTTDGSFVGECELVIFNFGRTVHQNIIERAPEDLRPHIERFLEKHGKRGIMGGRPFSQEALATLLALQDGVSSRSRKLGSDGGRGTVDIIESFQRLGQTYVENKAPKMVMLSGSARIVFDDKYSMKTEATGQGGQRARIAFNNTNSLNDPPDPANVNSIKAFFPGVLVAVRFYVDSKFLGSIKSAGDDNGRQNSGSC